MARRVGLASQGDREARRAWQPEGAGDSVHVVFPQLVGFPAIANSVLERERVWSVPLHEAPRRINIRLTYLDVFFCFARGQRKYRGDVLLGFCGRWEQHWAEEGAWGKIKDPV